MRLLGVVSYKGTNYAGWQKQPNALGVQEVIEKELSKFFNTEITIFGAGLTDAGVHAYGQTFHFDVDVDELDIDRLNNKIRKEQKKLSRCKLHSNNWNKQRKRLAKVYQYRDNYMLDNIHKATKAIVTKYDIIYMEDLDIKDLLSKQKIKKQKRKMLTSSLGKIRILLKYKCEHYGKILKKIDRYYPSSQTCSKCGKIYKVKSNEIYRCPHCKLIIDRDYNAAINILNYGIAHN